MRLTLPRPPPPPRHRPDEVLPTQLLHGHRFRRGVLEPDPHHRTRADLPIPSRNPGSGRRGRSGHHQPIPATPLGRPASTHRRDRHISLNRVNGRQPIARSVNRRITQQPDAGTTPRADGSSRWSTSTSTVPKPELPGPWTARTPPTRHRGTSRRARARQPCHRHPV